MPTAIDDRPMPEETPTLPTLDASADALGVTATSTTVFDWDYTAGRDQLLRLYDKGTRRQWVASDRIDWSTDLDPTNPLGVPDESIMLFGSSLWDRMDDARKSEVDAVVDDAADHDRVPVLDRLQKQRGRRRADEGRERDGQVLAEGHECEAAHDGDGCADGRCCRQAQREGAGQRVVQQGLHLHATESQRRAHHQCHQGNGQAHVQYDGARHGLRGRG